VVLLPATGVNVAEDELAAATDLLRAYLEQTGSFAVVLGRTPGGNFPEATPAEAGEEARAARTSLAVTLRISRLGSASSARLGAYRPDGTLLHSDALSAANADDLEPVLKRLALGLATARPAAKLAEIDTVTERESQLPRRIPASHVFGVRLGASWLVDRPEVGVAQRLSGAGFFWLYDARSFLAEAAVDWHGGKGDHVLEGLIGVYVPFSRRDVAPYAGLGLGYAIAHASGDTDAGLELRGTGGVLLGRLSTVQVRLEGGYRATMFTMSVDGQRRSVHGPYVTAGIGF
jgi:hypothetical protein